MKLASGLPPIFVAAHEGERLRQAARPLAERGYPVARFLLSELDRAILCRPGELPDDILAMKCRATYRVDDRDETESRFLVYPEDYAPYSDRVSVLSAVGAALLGLRVGDRMLYRAPDGVQHSVMVERIDYRPRGRGAPLRGRAQAAGPEGAA